MDPDLSLTDLRRDVAATLEEWRRGGRFEPQPDGWLGGYSPEFSRALGERGWLGFTWSTEHGGTGRGFRARFVVTEELLRVGAPIAAHWIADRQIGPAIASLGTEALKQRWLPGIARGETRVCLGMSETDAGSDLASVRTRAERVEGGWRLTGQKVWSSHAHHAHAAYVLARTSRGEDRHAGLTEFILDVDQPGVDIRRIPDLRGDGHFCEIFLDAAFVPDDSVLGEIDHGWSQVVEQLSVERGGPERVLSTHVLLRSALDHVRPDTSSAHALAAIAPRLTALRALGFRVATALDERRSAVTEAAALKLLGNRFELDVLDAVRRVERRDLADPSAWESLQDLVTQATVASPGFTLRGGTTEMLRGLVARLAGGRAA